MGAIDDLGKNNFSGTVGTKAGMNALRETGVEKNWGQ